MKLVIIRHGDPDYSIDSLTPTGWEEARLLADRICKLDVKAFYVSPLGRARDTASLTLEKMGREAEILPWLQEFPVAVKQPNREHPGVAWDWLPELWTAEPDYFDRTLWSHVGPMQEAGVPDAYAHITQELDKLLTSYGYVRNGMYYHAENPNEDTIVLFCHFGLECILLSHLLNISPMLLWHGTCAAPTSVTTLNTEERRQGIAYFRMSAFGDTSHLYAAGAEPSFAARFCETYEKFDPARD